MLASQSPISFVAPFANAAGAGFIRTIPTASQIGITAGAASLHDGYPPVCFSPVAAGGTPPWGQDTNGILNQTTAGVQWSQVGGEPVYNSAFSTAIGGYPNGAILQSADGTGFWRSTVDNNGTNPDTGGANWLPMFFSTSATIVLTNANVTLSAVQYSKPIIVLTGTLTAPVALTFPAFTQQWAVINSTVGSFSVTALVSGGAPVALSQGCNTTLRGNGTNVLNDVLGVSSVSSGSSPLFLESNNYVAAVNNGNSSYVQLYCAAPTVAPSAVTLGYANVTYAEINGSSAQAFATGNLTATGTITNTGACGFDTAATGSSFGGNLTAGGWITANGSVVRSATVFGFLNNTGAGNSGTTNSLGFGVYTVSGMQASQFWTLSDRRVKTEIVSLNETGSIDFVKSVTPVIYKKNGADVRERGFLAQDVGKAVGGDGVEMLNFIDREGLQEEIDEDGYVSPKDTLLVIDYNQILPIHASVLRNLLDRIEVLESKIKD